MYITEAPTNYLVAWRKEECWVAEINRKMKNIWRECEMHQTVISKEPQNISIARRSLELGVPKSTIQNVLHNCLRLHAIGGLEEMDQ
jgi:hypothetical protein